MAPLGGLKVLKLDPKATLPTVAYVGEDLGYDVYALEDCWIYQHSTRIHTGIACAAYSPSGMYLGLIVKDRSSMANKGLYTHGGVIDSGFRGEILINMTCDKTTPYNVQAGDKIAQMVPVMVLTGDVEEIQELPPGAGERTRGDNGHGSSGK